jgi:hypothetical protein
MLVALLGQVALKKERVERPLGVSYQQSGANSNDKNPPAGEHE